MAISVGRKSCKKKIVFASFLPEEKTCSKRESRYVSKLLYSRLRRLTNFQDEGIQIIVDRWFDCVFMDDGMQEEQLKTM